jgi:hypothetical protein
MTLWDNYRALRRRPAETFSEFLFGEEYLALPESEIYPGVVEIGNEIYEKFLNNSIDAAFVLAGLGSGKSTMAALLVCALAHWVLCLRDPHEYFGLLPDKPVSIPCMGITAGQVKDVVFASVRSFLLGGPFFQRLKPVMKVEPTLSPRQTGQRVLTTRATFTKNVDGVNRKILQIVAGNSVELFPLGTNVFGAVVDEISKFRDAEDRSQAKQIFETLDQRRLSRFGEAKHNGLIICIGTAGAEGEYVDRKLKDAASDPRTYIRRGRTWEMKGRNRYPGGTFHFVKRDMGPKGIRYECLDEAPKADGVVLHLPNVPDVFRKVFERDPMLAMRDFASISSLAISPWDMNAQALRRLVNQDREHPFYEGTWEPKPWFKGESGVEYCVHVDLALNREGKGDCAGLAMGHVIGEKRVEVGEEKAAGGDWEGRFEFRPIIQVDLLLRITAGEAGEILFSDVRNLLYVLLERGFDISGTPLTWDTWARVKTFRNGVTFDSYQSVDSIQLLKEHGITAGTYSVDKDLAPWETLREAVQDARIDVMPYYVEIDGLLVELLPYEYERLELVKRGAKYVVDHPKPHGHKDLVDAVAAVVHRLTLNHNQQGGFVP